MERDDKKVIITKLNSLVEGTDDLDGVMKVLKEKDILSDHMIEKIKKIDTDEKKKKYFYNLMTKRGPDAFINLYDAFMQTKCTKLAHILRLRLAKDITVKKSPRRMDIDRERMYEMGSRPKGYMLLINIKKFQFNLSDERLGSEMDEAKLIQLWENLGYEVTYHRDLTTKEFEKAIIDFRDMKEHENVHSVVIFIMTHGDQNPKYKRQVFLKTNYGVDIDSEWIIEKFYVQNCEKLKKKPKMFFFQSCRGENFDKGIASRIDGGFERVPNKSDILISFASCPGNVSLRNETLGALFVQKLCSVFKKEACCTDLVTMLEEVNREMKKEYDPKYGYQIINVESRQFDKKLYFNPGLYDD